MSFSSSQASLEWPGVESTPLGKQLVVWGGTSAGFGVGAVDKIITDPTKRHVPNTTWIQIVCCQFHSAAISSNGEVFTWGYVYDLDGKLGFYYKRVPTKVEIPGGEKVVKVACGLWHTAVVTATGKLFTWYAYVSYWYIFGVSKARIWSTHTCSCMKGAMEEFLIVIVLILRR